VPLVLVGLGGAAGAMTRYLVDSWVAQRTAAAFPWGTLVVNVSGSFVLGLLFALAIERDILPAQSRLPLMVGFVGAYTTFSTLMLESWRLVDGGAIAMALANVVGSAVLGLIAVVAGLVLGRALP
jgi:fluoride exporter